MKKRPAKKRATDGDDRSDAQMEAPATPALRAPTLPGSPLRVEEFPSLEETARLSCLLANGDLPRSGGATRSLAAAALEIWRACRDELRESESISAAYWKSRDETEAGLREALDAVKTFLIENEGSHLVGAKKVSWKEAVALLAHATSKKSAVAELERIVSEKLAGRSFWKSWTLKHFKNRGFDNLSFPSLIQEVAEDRARRRAEALSEQMREKARRSVESRRQREGNSEWGSLAAGKKIPTIRKKST